MYNVASWLKTHTFHHRDFVDIKKLVELKEQRNLKISLCFPTLNEEKTIGKTIVIMKSELRDRYPLLDEIVVMDSGSSDKTRIIAEKYGATTYSAAECLPEEGQFRGKGENLWKSLYLLQGDIIVFVDADISNIHHRFASGLLGPLLMQPELKFTKAFYNRPFRNAAGTLSAGGGRVTEVLVRPLFSQFFPELSGLVQPLSGEYAGYREVFEQIPFPVGYGVETGMLIDIVRKWGMDVIGQSNLELRIHRNQEIASLGKMSFGILQTFCDRLKKYRGTTDIDPESYLLCQIIQENNELKMCEHEIHEQERRPIIELEAYRRKFHLESPEKDGTS